MGQFWFSQLFVGFVTVGDEAMGLKPIPNTFTGYPGFPRAVVARNPWRQGGSRCGEGAQGDRQEGDGGNKSPPPERRLS
jgi:hypothetical protein